MSMEGGSVGLRESECARTRRRWQEACRRRPQPFARASAAWPAACRRRQAPSPPAPARLLRGRPGVLRTSFGERCRAPPRARQAERRLFPTAIAGSVWRGWGAVLGAALGAASTESRHRSNVTNATGQSMARNGANERTSGRSTARGTEARVGAPRAHVERAARGVVWWRVAQGSSTATHVGAPRARTHDRWRMKIGGRLAGWLGGGGRGGNRGLVRIGRRRVTGREGLAVIGAAWVEVVRRVRAG